MKASKILQSRIRTMKRRKDECFAIQQIKKQKLSSEDALRLLEITERIVKERAPRYFEIVPDEILAIILEFSGNWNSASRVCKRWRNLYKNDIIDAPLFDPKFQAPIMLGWAFLRFLKDGLLKNITFCVSLRDSDEDENPTVVILIMSILPDDTVEFKVDTKIWYDLGPDPAVVICKRFGWTVVDKKTWKCSIAQMVPAFRSLFFEWLDNDECQAFASFSPAGWKDHIRKDLFFSVIAQTIHVHHIEWHEEGQAEPPIDERYSDFLKDWQLASNFLCTTPVAVSDPHIQQSLARIPRTFWK
jgi:hypothetical protein